jgi:hypothetical protein
MRQLYLLKLYGTSDTLTMILVISILLISFTSVSDIHINGKFSGMIFAQDPNNLTVLTPNTNKLEIMLKNDQPVTSNSFLDSAWFVGLISGGSAIGGGFLGSFMTNRSNRQMEDKRYERERKREKEIQAQEEKKNVDYKQRVIVSTYAELREIHFWLKHIQMKEHPEDYPDTIKAVFQTIKMEYLKVPYDIRLSLFSPNLLYMVESIYSKIQAYTTILFSFIDEYKLHHTETFDMAVNKITPSANGMKGLIDIVLVELEKLLPEDLRERFDKDVFGESR